MKLSLLFSLPRSFIFCLRTLPLKQAVKIPIIVGRSCRIKGPLKKGSVVLDVPQLRLAMIRLGVGRGSFFLSQKEISFLQIKKDGQLVFHGNCGIRRGFRIMVNEGAILEFGTHVSLNSNTLISSKTKVVLGDYVLGGWNVTIIDWDGHDVLNIDNDTPTNSPMPIMIGEGCWLGAKSTILKGVALAKETIVPYGALITKSCFQEYVVYGGMPNKVIKANVYRKDGNKSFRM